MLEEKFEYVKIGRIINVNYDAGTCDVATPDKSAGKRKSVIYPYPYAGNGWGILVGPEENSQVLLSYDKENRPWIIAYRPNATYFNEDVQGLSGVEATDFPYRKPLSGEVILQSKVNSAIELNQQGDIRLETVDGLYFEINKGLETIFQQSVDSETVTESGLFKSGLVRRDIREDADKQQDVLFGSGFGLDTSSLLFSEVLGMNPEYQIGDFPKGLYNPAYDENLPETSLNAALTETRLLLEEYADSNVGLDQVQLADAAKAVGKMEVNRLMDIHLGTVVNDLGKIQRVDYGFGASPIGHGNIYAPSTDFFFNKDNTLKSPKKDSKYERVISELTKINAAIMMKILLHTKGADSQGILESDSFRGALWSLLVDKEGLTKLEIPAATNLGDEGTEPGRAGKSLLANLNGSMTLALGKEKSENNSVNKAISALSRSTKGRNDRSLTMDAAGNVELVLGADTEKKQSLILAADGSIEASFGKDTDKQRSIILTGEGGVYLVIKSGDIDGNAIVTDITGNVTHTVTGNAVTTVSGDLTAKISGTTVIDSPAIKIGSSGAAQHLVLGEKMADLFSNHYHIGNMGAPTSSAKLAGFPMTPELHLSLKHTTE